MHGILFGAGLQSMSAGLLSHSMAAQNEALEFLIEAGGNLLEASRRRAEGRRAVGHVITDVPVELLHAVDLYPVAILGHRGPAGSGREHLQSFTCSYSRGVLDLLLDGSMSFLEGVITPFVCDTTRAIDIVLRHMRPVPYVECYRPPKSLTGPGSRKYLAGEITRLKESIEKFAEVELTDDKINASIRLYNRARGELRRLEPMREVDPDAFYKICRAFMVLPVEEFIELAEKVEPPGEVDKTGSTPLLLAGKIPEPGDLPRLLSNLGARIVADDFATGSRLFAMDIDEEKGPIEAILDRQINNIPFVGLLQGPEDRPDFLVRRIKETQAVGAILMVHKFCEPFEIDAPEVRERLKREDIPVLVIETDFEPETGGALRTRIEAFLEMIGHG